jgi:hypothetical protein
VEQLEAEKDKLTALSQEGAFPFFRSGCQQSKV